MLKKIYCRENQRTSYIQQPYYENRVICEIMWKKYGTARQNTDNNITRCVQCASWISEATDT